MRASENLYVNAELCWRPMDEAAARAIVGWRYDGAYTLYNTAKEEIGATVRTLCAPQHRYFAISLLDGDLLGFCCFGEDARVPGGNYSDAALDIGIGIQPVLLGRGLGRRLLRQALTFANQQYAPPRFRATVATFNQRALNLCRSAGFQESSRFRHPDNKITYAILYRDAARVTESSAAILRVEKARAG